MRNPGIRVADFSLKYGLRHTLRLQTGWMILVGAVLLAMPTRRFSGPSWQFVVGVPHGDDWLGLTYVALGAIMATALTRHHQQLMAVALMMAGMMNWTLGVFLMAGAINGNAGGLGFPMALYPGGHMLLISAMLWRRKPPP